MKKLMIKYVVFSYLMFYVFLAIIGFVIMVLKLEKLGSALMTVSAWTSTFVFMFLFKKIYPNDSFFKFVKRQFCERIKLPIILTAVGIYVFILISNVLFFGIYNNQPLSELIILSPVTLITLFFSFLISGPLGEELGWRAFFQTELQKKYSPVKSAFITGLFWGFWHAVIWFLTSEFTGIKFIIFCVCFMVHTISLSIIMALLYNENRNLIIPIVIHQLSNYFIGIQKSETFFLFIVKTIITLIIAFICVIIFKYFIKKKLNTDGASPNEAVKA